MRGRGGEGREGEGMKGTCMWREWCEVNANCVISHTTKIKQRVQSDAADKIRDICICIFAHCT